VIQTKVEMRTVPFFVVAAALLFAGAILHVAALCGGPSWIAFVGAPREVVESASRGTWLAPVGALGIAALLLLLAAYALSAAAVLRSLPFSRSILTLFAAIFIVRGLIILPALLQGRFSGRDHHDLFVVASSTAILAIGLALLIGLVGLNRSAPPRRKAG
jgi:hypothetical protein